MPDKDKYASSDDILKRCYTYYYDNLGPQEAVEQLSDLIKKGLAYILDKHSDNPPEAVCAIMDMVEKTSLEKTAQSISLKIQDLFKLSQDKYMVGLVIGGQDGEVLKFLPDVEIEKSPEKVEQWTLFLSSMDARCRKHGDCETGLQRIPFRQGVWFHDLIFPSNKPLFITEDIDTIQGDLVCLSKKILSDHKVTVDKNVKIVAEHLTRENKLIEHIHGELDLLTDDKTGSIEHTGVDPNQLVAWKLVPGKILVINSKKRYLFNAVFKEDDVSFTMTDVIQTGAKMTDELLYVWTGDKWVISYQLLPMSLLNSIRITLRRTAVTLGLGKTYLHDHTDYLRLNIEKLRLICEYCLGFISEGGISEPGDKISENLATLVNCLATIYDHLGLTGGESTEDLDAVAKDIKDHLDVLTDDFIRTLRPVPGLKKKKINIEMIVADHKYLDKVRDATRMVDTFRTAGNTVVFFNNYLTSKHGRQAVKTIVEEIVSHIRTIVSSPDADNYLVGLLKGRKKNVMDQLLAAYPKKKDDIEVLEEHFNEFAASKPKDVIASLAKALAEGGTDGADLDMVFVSSLRTRSGSDINDLFAKDGDHDMALLRKILFVNLSSVAAHALKTDEFINKKTPVEALDHLIARSALMEFAARAYNKMG